VHARGAPLCEGELEGTVLTCPWHAATFDVVTGKALTRRRASI
jgi:nitrite reductase/ring-hydroxylating ferredoxin subunit